mmetsp:Transcript_26793/g.59924  ORF Transcript_26793/g.59924 Transcript_26793/m.59924 type:complete len:82 (-) Transcript_26793:637-882(-)
MCGLPCDLLDSFLRGPFLSFDESFFSYQGPFRTQRPNFIAAVFALLALSVFELCKKCSFVVLIVRFCCNLKIGGSPRGSDL